MSDGVIRHDGYRWLHPQPRLANCIYAAVVADTRTLHLAPEDRLNYFPATPFCTLSLFLDGASVIVDGNKRGAEASVLPKVVVAGPQSGPTISMNPGSVQVVSVGLFPEALQRLIGQDISELRGRILAADSVLPADLAEVCRKAADCSEAEMAFAMLQDGLSPLWQSLRPASPASFRLVGDWARALLHRAATSRSGRSLRQIERRMKRWTGQTHRELVVMGRTEAAFIDAYQRLARDREDWAQLAAGAGYSDQPHLVREVRRVTGFAPGQLRKRIKSEHAFWFYRLMGELY